MPPDLPSGKSLDNPIAARATEPELVSSAPDPTAVGVQTLPHLLVIHSIAISVYGETRNHPPNWFTWPTGACFANIVSRPIATYFLRFRWLAGITARPLPNMRKISGSMVLGRLSGPGATACRS
jgi:hypothetical protein